MRYYYSRYTLSTKRPNARSIKEIHKPRTSTNTKSVTRDETSFSSGDIDRCRWECNDATISSCALYARRCCHQISMLVDGVDVPRGDFAAAEHVPVMILSCWSAACGVGICWPWEFTCGFSGECNVHDLRSWLHSASFLEKECDGWIWVCLQTGDMKQTNGCVLSLKQELRS